MPYPSLFQWLVLLSSLFSFKSWAVLNVQHSCLAGRPNFFGSILKINQVPLLGFCARPSVPSVLYSLPTPRVVVVRVRRPASVTPSCIGEIGATHVRPVAPRSAHGLKRHWVEKSTTVRVGFEGKLHTTIRDLFFFCAKFDRLAQQAGSSFFLSVKSLKVTNAKNFSIQPPNGKCDNYSCCELLIPPPPPRHPLFFRPDDTFCQSFIAAL